MRHCFDFEVAAEPSAEDVATKDYAPFHSLSSRDTWMCAVLNNEFLRLLDGRQCIATGIGGVADNF